MPLRVRLASEMSELTNKICGSEADWQSNSAAAFFAGMNQRFAYQAVNRL